jgi:hypothetical protein
MIRHVSCVRCYGKEKTRLESLCLCDKASRRIFGNKQLLLVDIIRHGIFKFGVDFARRNAPLIRLGRHLVGDFVK